MAILLKGLVCGSFRLARRGFSTYFGCMREHVDALGSSAISSMIVACAQCDIQMYQSLGFSIKIGNLFAFEP